MLAVTLGREAKRVARSLFVRRAVARYFRQSLSSTPQLVPGADELEQELTEWRRDFHMHPVQY